MWGDASLTLAATCLLSWIPSRVCDSHTAPGRPELTKCRSPEKETFTCWWEPGSSGGLPTTHRLFYIKERSEKVLECPNYHRAGNNSCFFDKAHTSIWVLYNITVMASNSYGNTFSEPVEVDVMDIVQPHSPENVTLTILGAENNPYFLVQWEAPHDTDTRSGWVTLKYEVRVKLESSRQKASEWELYSAGKQKELSIYSPQPGGTYSVQARCRLDHGLWSEWSPLILIQVPDNSLRERSVMISMLTISASLLLVAAGILAMKRKFVKDFFLPPVPGPKIKGFDTQLLKTEKSEDIFHALTLEGFPLTPECPDQVDFLVVVDSEEDIDQSRNNVSLNCPNSDQHASGFEGGVCCSLPTENPSKEQQNNRWKRSRDSKDSDPESIAGLSKKFSGIFSSLPDVQHLKSIVRNSQSSCISNFKESNALICPKGLMEYIEGTDSEDCKPPPTTGEEEGEEGDNYSKVSGIYSDSVLVLQKDSIPIHPHRKEL